MIENKPAYVQQQQLIGIIRQKLQETLPVEMIETHTSWVMLSGDHAYKFKKALNLGFLDYTKPEARRYFCEEEIRLNRRTAPDIYLDTLTVGGSPENPQFDVEPAFEFAVRMRRFPSGNLMDDLLQRGKVSHRHIDSLANNIASFHKELPVADKGSAFGTAGSVNAPVIQNFEQLRELLPDLADSELIFTLEMLTNSKFAECENIFEIRRNGGFVRECHGDLHLGNITLINDTPVPFDCIEFNPAFRWIDVMDELAFLVMDLLHRGHPDLAWRLLNAYLEETGDYRGIAVLRFYLAYRATVRGKVSAIRAGQSGVSEQVRSEGISACRSYLTLAHHFLNQMQPALIIMHGLSGSGKTTFSQSILEQTGAIRIRSDVERKRLFGLNGLDNSDSHSGNIYSAEATRQTYDHLLDLAKEILSAGFPVIVDATFLMQNERELFYNLAQSMSVPFMIASMTASESTLRDRIRQRRDDASEADETVLELQLKKQQPLSPSELNNTVLFIAEESFDSEANAQSRDKLFKMIHFTTQ